MAAEAGIACAGLHKAFGEVEAVRDFSAHFASAQTTALVGPSGCGKSTLLRLIAGLDMPDRGTVAIDGQPPERLRERGAISVAFQDPSLLPWLTAARNVALARKLARQPADPALVARLLQMVGLGQFAQSRPATLSGGMRQRAAIARALVTGPGVLLLDEPFGAVDELTRRQLAQDLPPLWHEMGATTLLVTHSVSEAVLLSDRVLVLSPRPAQIVADIDVPLPHPRSPALPDTPAFHRIEAQIRAALSHALDAA
ncbi:ABC transporter ATP-binding protein [Paracoccus laeviglucosivorans]|uniref:NitT/TauT family transport system ATP-binding protein n=1 Tax=Paracoccus laeviglucosivorans TaxID=1197861 RepID=A0A521ETZ7_9RHOB|nr:ABC transporter ATP-binding protein [Paracoccus laeviglucosivorans]SMO87377.1 NitT/TauT family transport system ATP-binding protein [Paracoccus laeviglucosivorans]